MKYYEYKSGYKYKEYKNGKKVRISDKEYYNKSNKKKYGGSKSPKNMNITYENLNIGRILGRGTTGIVYKATVKKNINILHGKSIALKEISESYFNNNLKRESFLKEIYILKRIDHPNIVKLYNHFEHNGKHYLVMEYIEGQQLDEYIKSKKLSIDESKKIFYEIAKTIKYLTDNKIAHRDIKLENIMMSSLNQVKLIDLGLACEFSNQRKLIQCGTPEYVAPEVVREPPNSYNTEHLFFKRDVWALGVIMYYMIIGYFPFTYNNNTNILNLFIDIREYNFRKETEWEKTDDDFKDLISKVLEKDTIKRFNIDEVLQHKWFSDISSKL